MLSHQPECEMRKNSSDRTLSDRKDLQASLQGPKGYSCTTMKREVTTRKV